MRSSRERARNAAGLNLVYPGLGHALQGRRTLAIWLALDFTGLLAGGLLQPAMRGIWWGLAVTLGLYAIGEAYWHDRHRAPETRAV